EERVRASSSSLAETADAAADLTGALDILEAALAGSGPARLTTNPTPEEDDKTGREVVATLVRRAGELRDEIRLLLRASDSDYVYFVEFRGRGIFLRAAPVDVSAIV